MYLITSKDDGVHIFQCDLDGTNRESKILLMKDEMEKGNAVGVVTVLVNGDEIYYTAAYQEQGDASQINKNPIKAVRRVDLNRWTEQEICRSVENIYSVIGAETGGVLLLEKPDAWVVTDVDWGQSSEKDKEQGVLLLTKEQMQKLPVTVFYWDKNTNHRMTVYQSNYAEKSHVTFAEKNYLYCLASPEGLEDLIGLEKVDMRTGQTEWLWKEKAGPESGILDCWKRNNRIYFTVMKGDDACPLEVYTADEFEKIALPFLLPMDTLLFDDEHGYVVWKTIEHRENNTNGDVVDIIFIPIEEAGKENPEYTVLESGERD